MSHTPLALAVFDDGGAGGPALYAAGDFDFAGSVAANHIARWNGSQWSSVGTAGNGVSAPNGGEALYDLAVFDDGSGAGPALYAGGYFTTAGGVSANNIARWDGTAWSAVGGGLEEGLPFVFTVFDDGGGPALYVGGSFRKAGGMPANRIAKWDETRWSALGNGVASGSVAALEAFDDGNGGGPGLFVGGYFSISEAGDSHLTKWGCPSPPSPFTTFCTAKTGLICGPANINATGTPSSTDEWLRHRSTGRARLPLGPGAC